MSAAVRASAGTCSRARRASVPERTLPDRLDSASHDMKGAVLVVAEPEPVSIPIPTEEQQPLGSGRQDAHVRQQRWMHGRDTFATVLSSAAHSRLEVTCPVCSSWRSPCAPLLRYWINDITVVHMYRQTFAGTCKGEPATANWSSTVWTNKGGKWVAAFHQESEILPAPPAAK